MGSFDATFHRRTPFVQSVVAQARIAASRERVRGAETIAELPHIVGRKG